MEVMGRQINATSFQKGVIYYLEKKIHNYRIPKEGIVVKEKIGTTIKKSPWGKIRAMPVGIRLNFRSRDEVSWIRTLTKGG